MAFLLKSPVWTDLRWALCASLGSFLCSEFNSMHATMHAYCVYTIWPGCVTQSLWTCLYIFFSVKFKLSSTFSNCEIVQSTGNFSLNQPIFDTQQRLPHLARHLVHPVRYFNGWEADQAVGYLRACGDEGSCFYVLCCYFFFSSQSHHGSPHNGCDWWDDGVELESCYYPNLLLSFRLFFFFFFVSSPTSQQIPIWLSPLSILFFSFKDIKKPIQTPHEYL